MTKTLTKNKTTTIPTTHVGKRDGGAQRCPGGGRSAAQLNR